MKLNESQQPVAEYERAKRVESGWTTYQLVYEWTTRAEQFGPRSQKTETHYKTSSGHQRALVPWFLEKQKNLPLALNPTD